jgi:hypothetical protein
MTKQDGAKFSGQKFYQKDFSKQKLKFSDFSRCSLLECDFTDADCSYSNFSNANCYGSNFTGTSLYRSNFMEAQLQKVIFKPRDCFGITLTWKCDTFRDMEVDSDWLEVWSFMPSLMKLPESWQTHVQHCESCSQGNYNLYCKEGKLLFRFKDKLSWTERLIEFVGPDRYLKLKAIFDRRII